MKVNISIPWDERIVPLTDEIARSAVGKPVTFRGSAPALDRVVGTIERAWIIEGPAALGAEVEIEDALHDAMFSFDVSTRSIEPGVVQARAIPPFRVVDGY